jgi:hypothetical protein
MFPVVDPEEAAANRRLQRALSRELRVSRRIGRLLTDREASALVGLAYSYDPLDLRAHLRKHGGRLTRRVFRGKPCLIHTRTG